MGGDNIVEVVEVPQDQGLEVQVPIKVRVGARSLQIVDRLGRGITDQA